MSVLQVPSSTWEFVYVLLVDQTSNTFTGNSYMLGSQQDRTYGIIENEKVDPERSSNHSILFHFVGTEGSVSQFRMKEQF